MQGFDKQDILTGGGVTLAGHRYIYLSGSDRIIRAKLGRNGVHCMKTQQGNFFLFESFLKNHFKYIFFLFLISCNSINL